MRIFVNNEPTETSAQTLDALAGELKLPERGVAVAVEGQIAPRAQWPSTAIGAEAHVTIIKATFGG
jgi:sulfur carrier protein